MSIFRNGNYPLETKEQDVKSMFELVRACPYIADNLSYSETIKATKIYYESDNESVNAYASVRDESSESFKIVIFQGICNAFKLGALAMAEFDANKNINRFVECVKWIGKKAGETGTFSISDIKDGISALDIKMTGNICREAKSYVAGSLLSVIGHEAGHIILKHVVREDTGEANSRNDERMADLVSCAVSESTPFCRYSILGGLIMEIVFNWLHSDMSPSDESSHPHSKERVHNMVNSHREYLESLGLSINNIDQFLP